MELQDLLDNLTGDLDYNPKRGALYFVVGVLTVATWAVLPAESRFTTVPLIVACGGVPLLFKAVFFLRKSSEGYSVDEGTSATDTALPPLSTVGAQLLQDFGAGPLVLGQVMHLANGLNQNWMLPGFSVSLAGAVLFLIGWLIRRFL